jgi:uncharacterized glyoxalase superfamily protein PhnB
MPDHPAARCTHTIPCLAYADAHAAIDWLTTVLGAEARAVYPAPDGRTVAHAELWFGGACLMMGSLKPDAGRPPTVPGQGVVYLVVDGAASVDALHARAVEGGARIVIPLQDTDYGSRDFGCLDLEGNFFSFGTYLPARAPALTAAG